ncbi:MAG TPA: SBBP repeat-containing protein, partial [Terriglobales bacterium]
TGAVQTTYGGGSFDAFVAKISFQPGSAATLAYATFLGGGASDIGRGIAVDASGNGYVTGDTSSPDFPTANAIQSACGGTCIGNAFVAELNPAGSAKVFSTYLGGSGTAVTIGGGATSGDSGNAIAVDAAGNIYVSGNTASVDFPHTSGSCNVNSKLGACENVFVTKLAAAGTALKFSTIMGGSGLPSSTGQLFGDTARAIALDGSGNIFVAGRTYSKNYPNFQLMKPNCNNTTTATTPVSDAFVTELDPSGSILDTECFGGSDKDAANAIAIDAHGAAIVAGSTFSPDFPVSGLNMSFGGVEDGFVAKATGFIAGGQGVITCNKPTITQDPKNPLAISLQANCTDSQANANITYTVNWGDGAQSTGTSATASHSYAAPNTYAVVVSAVDAAGNGTSITECFALAPPPSSPVPQGQSATVTVQVAAPPGVSSTTVKFTCASVSGPNGVLTPDKYFLSCTLNGTNDSTTMTMGSSAQPLSVVVHTNTSPTSALLRPATRWHPLPMLAFLLPISGVFLVQAGPKLCRRRLLHGVLLLALTLLLISWIGCGGGSAPAALPPPPPPNAITPVGNYSVNVAGVDNANATQATVTVGFVVTTGP